LAPASLGALDVLNFLFVKDYSLTLKLRGANEAQRNERPNEC
jgi:hypothetical protein